MSLSPNEYLSFYDANNIPVSDQNRLLLDIYVTPTGQLAIRKAGETIEVGKVTPTPPISVDTVELDGNLLVLKMHDNTEIVVGDVSGTIDYIVPPMPDKGIRQTDGSFALPTVDASLQFIEEAQNFRLSGIAAQRPSLVKYAEVAMRRDFTGIGGTDSADNTGITANNWSLIRLNTVVDPENIGITISNNQVTFPPGTYYVDFSAVAHRCGYHTLQLWSVTHNRILAQSFTLWQSDNTESSSSSNMGNGYFTIAQPTVIEARVKVGTVSGATAALWAIYGPVIGSIADYFKIEIWKQPEQYGTLPPVKVLTEVTPRMTGYTGNGLTISSSGERPGGYQAWKALSGDDLESLNCWASGGRPTPQTPQWLKYTFNSPTLATRYRFYYPYPLGAAVEGAIDWTIQGRMSNGSWVILDTVVGWNSFIPGICIDRPLNNAAAYDEYQIVITNCRVAWGGQQWTYVGELRLYIET